MVKFTVVLGLETELLFVQPPDLADPFHEMREIFHPAPPGKHFSDWSLDHHRAVYGKKGVRGG
jgi:hypothetical protein